MSFIAGYIAGLSEGGKESNIQGKLTIFKNDTFNPGDQIGCSGYALDADGVHTIEVQVPEPKIQGDKACSQNNTTVYPDEGYVAMKSVTVNVPEKSYITKPLTVKNGGIYYASDHECDGFDPVNAEIVDKLKKVIEQIPAVLDGDDPDIDGIEEDIVVSILNTIVSPKRPIAGGASVGVENNPETPEQGANVQQIMHIVQGEDGAWRHYYEIYRDGNLIKKLDPPTLIGGSPSTSLNAQIINTELVYSYNYGGYNLRCKVLVYNEKGDKFERTITVGASNSRQVIPQNGNYTVNVEKNKEVN